MSQIALPLSAGQDRPLQISVGNDNRAVLDALLVSGTWPFRTAVLSGPPRSGKTLIARLFAQGGRPVPVILDDALVHSDDDRIEAMFTALHRVAQGQQILVLTCRQRAFATLGGERAKVTVELV